MRLSAKCHRPALDCRFEFCQALDRRCKNTLIAVDLLGGLAKSRVGYCERQVHVPLLKRMIVRERVFVLCISPQDDFMLLGG